MNEAVQKLVQLIFKKNSLNDCSIQELQNLSNQYPYFTPAQLLLCERLKSVDETQYQQQLQKLSLYFNNPLWLDYLLTADEKKVLEEMMPESADDRIVGSSSNELGENRPSQISNEDLQEASSEIHAEKEISNQSEFISQPQEQSKNSEMLFQPYHTVDYFASQGIKFKPEEKPTDRFGQQLKSFTEWLKLMKRLPAGEMDKSIDTTSEEKVQQLADHSIADKNIITEAMAEVWLKQGNRENAIKIYNKLSLLNPDKSSYFAGLVEKIKNNT